MLRIISDNFEVSAIGTLTKIPTLRGTNVTTSINQVKQKTSIRGLMEYTINIVKMEQEEYDKMINMFLYDGEFSIIDTERNFEGNKYFIEEDTFSLAEIEDKKRKCYYYSGSFKVTKS